MKPHCSQATHLMATFTIPARPPALPVWRTCIYKIVGKTPIAIDIYLPAGHNDPRRPLMLFIHGGGWTGSNRTDYCRPLFHHFLALNFVVASMDYRLVPESSHQDQLDDIRDVEQWLRNCLPGQLGEIGDGVTRRIVVAGASAGGQLALLTVRSSPTESSFVWNR